jgi:hypothetical protein
MPVTKRVRISGPGAAVPATRQEFLVLPRRLGDNQ